MSKTHLAAVVALGIFSTNAKAATKTYSFVGSGGTPYCGYVELAQSGHLASVTVYGGSCGGATTYAIGTRAKAPGEVWTYSQGDETGGNLFLWVIDEKALTWTLYYEAADYSIGLALLNDGSLAKGKQGQFATKSILGGLLAARRK